MLAQHSVQVNNLLILIDRKKRLQNRTAQECSILVLSKPIDIFPKIESVLYKIPNYPFSPTKKTANPHN